MKTIYILTIEAFMSVIMQRLLLFFMVIACYEPVYAQLSCCQVLPVPGSPFSAGLFPNSVAFSPNGNCLAVANFASNNISVFVVDPDTCALTPAPGSPFELPENSGPVSVAFSPNGNCLAVANTTASTISVFTVDPDTCSLTSVGDPVSAGGINPVSVAFSVNNCLAVANSNTSTVSVFTVDPACNLISVGMPIGVGAGPVSVAFSPTSNCLAVANSGSDNISVFIVDPITCSLTPASGSPFSLPDGSAPNSVAFSSQGTCLAVVNNATATVSMFTVDPDTCNLTPVGESVPTGGIIPVSVAFSANNCLAVANPGSDTISVFTVNPDCSLTFVGTPIAASSPVSVAFSPITNCLAVADAGANTILVFSPLVIQQPTITSAVVTNCTTVTVTGTSNANATITLFVNGVANTTGVSDDAGNFTIDTTPLPAGTYSITVVATILDCSSIASAPATVTIAIPTITSATIGCGNFVTITGTSTPNSTVSIAANNLPIATGVTNSEGAFIFAGIQLPSGFQCITAIDTASGCSSAPVCINVSPLSCILGAPNLAFGTHCNRLQ